jgi:hypothetical protein
MRCYGPQHNGPAFVIFRQSVRSSERSVDRSDPLTEDLQDGFDLAGVRFAAGIVAAVTLLVAFHALPPR